MEHKLKTKKITYLESETFLPIVVVTACCCCCSLVVLLVSKFNGNENPDKFSSLLSLMFAGQKWIRLIHLNCRRWYKSAKAVSSMHSNSLCNSKASGGNVRIFFACHHFLFSKLFSSVFFSHLKFSKMLQFHLKNLSNHYVVFYVMTLLFETNMPVWMEEKKSRKIAHQIETWIYSALKIEICQWYFFRFYSFVYLMYAFAFYAVGFGSVWICDCEFRRKRMRASGLVLDFFICA